MCTCESSSLFFKIYFLFYCVYIFITWVYYSVTCVFVVNNGTGRKFCGVNIVFPFQLFQNLSLYSNYNLIYNEYSLIWMLLGLGRTHLISTPVFFVLHGGVYPTSLVCFLFHRFSFLIQTPPYLQLVFPILFPV